jgi:hypothetical protein
VSPASFVFYDCPDASTTFALQSGASDGGSAVISATAAQETIGATVVLYADSTGNLSSFAPSDAGSVALGGNVSVFELSADESTVAFQTNDGLVATTPARQANVRVAVPEGGAAELGPLSRDARYVLFASTLGDGGPGAVAAPTDVQLASTAGGATRVLVPTTTSCPGCLEDSFTPDGTYALALDPIDDSQSAGGTGPLHAFPLDGGADSRLGTNVWTVIALDAGAGASSRFLFVESTPNAALLNGASYTLYTRSLDPSDTPVPIASGVEWAGLDEARANVVYSIPGEGPLAGVWVAPL